MTCPHHLPALIPQSPHVLSVAATPASPKHQVHPTSGPLYLLFSLLEYFFPHRLTWFPPSLPLSLYSKVTFPVRPLPPCPAYFFPWTLSPVKHLLYFPSSSCSLSPLLDCKLYASRDFCLLCSPRFSLHLREHLFL